MTSREPERSAHDELRNALAQLQVYEAIAVAANDAHAVLDAMLNAADPDAAHLALRQRYGFSEDQAQAVIEMQFRRMTSNDRRKIKERRDELAAQVEVLEKELGS